MSHSFPKVMDLGRSGEQNMASTSSSAHLAAHVLMKKGKRGAATYVYSECVNSTHLQILNELLDIILCPGKAIDEWETIDWCKWLMAGGRTPDDFSTTVLCYDNATTCGLVWTANFVAYRCRTCGISPCMSLCAECFKKGNHTDHDFNMFRSQAGGACDCGDTSVMQETGFCDRHGPRAQENKPAAPRDLMCVAEAMMPRIILRLIQHLREHSNTQAADSVLNAIKDADAFLTMLLDFSAMGAAMRRVMTGALTNPQIYKNMTEHQVGDSEFMRESKRVYEEAVRSLPNPEPPDEYKGSSHCRMLNTCSELSVPLDCPSLQEQLIHCTFLEELVFWTVKFEFPQKMVCLLLNMLPDPDYKEALTQAFVLHYSRISMMLEKSSDPDALSNRVVHVSVQLFSNEGLAFRMCEKLNLLHVMVISLKYMMSKILIQNTLHDPDKNFHYVVDCARQVMKEHCYWPLVSDLNNVLSHKAVALKFMSDDNLLEMWFAFLAMFQGMNVNQREVFQHVEFEPNTYYAAFSAELEASAYPMGSMVSHLSDPSFVGYTKRVLASCLTALQDWLDAINFTDPSVGDTFQVSFHLPLHRYFSVFMCQAIKHQGMALRDILPSPDILHLMMMHPLRVQVAFYEILSGMWVRNGLQIKGQAMTYIQCNFCNSMVDADIYLLQVCATQLSAHTFLDTVADKFHTKEWMSMTPYISNTFLEGEHDTAMLESFLTFLATLMSVRTNLGLSDVALRQLEIVTLLCMGDKTHSQLLELMPESRGNYQGRDFESELSEVADYTEPNCEASGNMQHGMYSPKAHIWEHMYDPVHVLLRAVHRRDFQSSMDHFTEYARHSNQVRSGSTPWPPFRIPSPCSEAYEDPRKLLCSRTFHAMAFAILFRAVRTQNVPEQALSLIIFLLEMAVDIAEPNTSGMQVCQNFRLEPKEHVDLDFSNWFESDWLSANLRTVIDCVTVRGETRPSAEPWESSGSGTTEGEVLTPSSEGHGSLLMLEEGETEPMPQEPEEQTAAAGNALALPRIPTSPFLHAVTLLVNNAGPAILAQLMPSSSQGVVATTSAGGSSSVAGPSTSMPSTSGRHRSQEPSINEAASSSSSNQCTDMVPSMVATDSEDQASLRRRAYTNLGGGTTYHMAVCVGESLISLLLKLHSNLSGAPDSFELDEPPNPPVQGGAPHPASESRVGDGPFFVAKLLHRIAKLDPMCREAIVQTKERLWPKREEEKDEEREAREAREREERRRRAKERQQRLMAEFATRQKQFMEKARETEEEGGGMDWSEAESPMISKKEYDCVICNQATPSTDEKPMGLVVLLQATSILGHKRLTPEPPVLPTSEEEKLALRRDDCLASEFDKRVEELNRQFDSGSWLLSVNLGWEGGVHVQTCGHHLHLDCLKSYLHSLRSQQRQQSLAVERGEYSCPLCRQLANSVLPLSPQLGECAALARSRPASMVSMVSELSNLLKDNPPVPTNSSLMEAMGKSMEDMTNTTSTRYKHQHGTPSSQCLFLFVSSIARTNLEVEVVQRGGSIVSPRPDDAAALALIPKRSCIVPLLHVLAMHARVLTTWPAWQTWLQAAGVSAASTPGAQAALSPYEREVPLLLREPSTLLTHFLLQLPLHLEQTYFSCVVKVLYNVLYFQALAQLSCRLSEAGRAQWCTQGQEEGGRSLDTLEACMALLVSSLEPGQLYIEEATGWDGQGGSGDRKHLENDLQTMCLPFLRIAALLRHHLYGEELPEIRSDQAEFVRLVYYLELVTEGMDWRRFNAAVALNWPWRDASSSSMTGSTTQLGVEPQTPDSVVRGWCAELLAFAHRSQSAARSLLAQHNRWHQPRLLRLPHLYDKLFQFYHRRQCSQCHSVPRETSVCLLCGAVVCLKENCCKQQNVCEAVQHSMDCGAGTAMYLVVTSSYIIVIRGKRACLWGSVYLDSFGEEDRDLKRGKPLYLSPGRYQLLEQQWLSHRFDHTNKKWVWHREAL